MSIRVKIILIVAPLLVTTLLLAGLSSSLSARAGITRLAVESLGFKAQELRKYSNNQWDLLVNNNLADNPDYQQVAKEAITSYAGTLVRGATEMILAVDAGGAPAFVAGEGGPAAEELAALAEVHQSGREGWAAITVDGRERVGQVFRFAPFDWFVFVTDQTANFYREVNEILVQNAIILAASLVVAVVLLLIFVRVLTSPLGRVVDTMRGIITKNDLTARVTVEFNDEIGTLAQTFNVMIGELQRAYDQIKSYAFKAVLAQKNEKKIRNIFQKYVPKDVIDSFIQKPEAMLVGQNRTLAVLFSDIRSFTTISEGYRPDELVQALNRYFGKMVDIIMDHNGIVDKYIGDAIMAFFGAPVQRDDDALQAVITGLEMQEALLSFNQEQRDIGKPEFLTGIGVNYGIVTVGNIGSEKKMDYTVIGDMVNLGSRLEGLTKEYKQGVLFSKSVFKVVDGHLPCRLIDKVQVKGKTVGEEIYTARLSIDDDEKKAWGYHHMGAKKFYSREFGEAKRYFEACMGLLPKDHVAHMFVERCDAFIAEPPPDDWTGVDIKKTK